jgi:hypothetical protein
MLLQKQSRERVVKNKNIIVVRNLIETLSIESLKNSEVVANLVRAFGIVQWGPPVFGSDEMFKNPSGNMAGIYQTPAQIGKALVYLSEFSINSYLEIGVFQGGNYFFVSEYLRRFNPDIKCLGIDPTQYLNDEIRAIIETEMYLSFKGVTSEQLKGSEFDLVFIDGEHTGGWVKRDYENVGQYAKFCMFHDIQETTCPEVVEFWKTIKNKKSIEFLDHESERPLHGIGIIRKDK